jgi:hypothetical protein
MAKANIILASVAAAALFPALAFAQHAPYNVINGQIQLGDAIGQLNVHVGSAQNVTAPSVAAGNNMAAKAVERDMNVDTRQTLGGRVIATTNVAAGDLRGGATVATANATGNAAQVEGCCANTNVFSEQITKEGSKVAARSVIRTGSGDTLVSATQAVGNNYAGWSANGSTDSFAGQYNAATIQSHSLIEACCNNESVTSSAVGAANSARFGGESSTVYAGVNQKNYAGVDVTSRVNINSATNVTSAASAAGNLAEVQNKWGYAQLDGYQENNGRVRAGSAIHLNDWNGFAVSGSNAIGNSAILSNLGSDATIGMTQNNFGAVSSHASLAGNSSRGGVGVVTATAVGNAITGYACASCGQEGVKVEGYSAQYNYAPVTAYASAHVGTAGTIAASATAVGNSATFIAQRGGH